MFSREEQKNVSQCEQIQWTHWHIVYYKNLTWVWGADRKFCPEGHCLASGGFAKWCKTVIPRNRIFYPHRTLMFDSFSCIHFDFECFILKVAFITTHNDDDVGHYLKWRHCDVAMTSTKEQNYVTSYTTNANQIHMKNFFLGWDNMGGIRISIPSKNLRFSYPVCKNIHYPCKLGKSSCKLNWAKGSPGELIVYQWYALCLSSSFTLSGQVDIFDQILCVASLGWGKGCIRFLRRLDQSSDFHGNKKCPLTYNGENDVSTFSLLLGHLIQRLKKWAYSIPMICRPSVAVIHFF